MSNYSIKTFIGMDLGDIENQICILDQNGEIVEKTSVENNVSGVKSFFDRFDSPRQVLVAVETGTHSPPGSANFLRREDSGFLLETPEN